MPIIDNLNNGQKANGIPFTSLPEENSPSDYGYMVVTDDVLKLKRITRGNFFKGIFAGGNVLSGRGEPDDGLGHDGDIYADLGTDITTITDFIAYTDFVSYPTWDVKYDDPGTDNGWYYETVVYPYATNDMSYHSENGVLNGISIRNHKNNTLQRYLSPQLIDHFENDLAPHTPRGGVISLSFAGVVEGAEYPVKYPPGVYNISFDLVVSGGFRPNYTLEDETYRDRTTGEEYSKCEVYVEPCIGVSNFSTYYPPAGNKRRYWYRFWNTNGFAHHRYICMDPDDPEHYNRVVYNGYWYNTTPGDYPYFIPINSEPGTYHIDFTSYGSPSLLIDLGALKCDLINGGPGNVIINNLRVTPVTIYAESIQNLWLKSEGRWNKDEFVFSDDLSFNFNGYLGTTLASFRYKGNTYYLHAPENYSDVDSVGISREYQTGTEVFYMDIDGQRTRVYNPPSEYEVGYLQGYRSTDPNGRKIYTDEISTLAINGLTTTYSGSTRFIAKRNALYKVVFHMNIYKNDRGNLVCYTNKESFYAKLNMQNPTWSWVDGPPEVRIPAKDFEGTRFSVYTELIGYIETSENSNEEIPRFALDIGGKNFMYSNSYEIMVYFNTVMTRIR